MSQPDCLLISMETFFYINRPSVKAHLMSELSNDLAVVVARTLMFDMLVLDCNCRFAS